jgi:integrase/recombinase XerD
MISLNELLSFDEVIVKTVRHYNKQVVGIYFPKSPELLHAAKKIPGIRFSKSCGCWYVDREPDVIDKIKDAFGSLAIVRVEGNIDNEETDLQAASSDSCCPKEYMDLLRHKRYSEATCRNYTAQFGLFLNYFPNKTPDEITDDEIKRYMDYLILKKQISTSTQNVVINAIKFYYEKVKGRAEKYYAFERPIREIKLPVVMSEHEVLLVLKACENLKHKTMLFIIYSGGLRRGELINLRVTDIDVSRNVINIRGAKGKKDRITLLSEKTLALLSDYYEKYKPTYWVFEGEGHQQYSASSLNKVFINAVRKSGITKLVTLHSLRHSFATHLLEHGTDIRYIQSLLGHNSSTTTEIYAHVTKRGFENLRSPLDNLDI